jgi:hypothetical protein
MLGLQGLHGRRGRHRVDSVRPLPAASRGARRAGRATVGCCVLGMSFAVRGEHGRHRSSAARPAGLARGVPGGPPRSPSAMGEGADVVRHGNASRASAGAPDHHARPARGGRRDRPRRRAPEPGAAEAVAPERAQAQTPPRPRRSTTLRMVGAGASAGTARHRADRERSTRHRQKVGAIAAAPNREQHPSGMTLARPQAN